MKKNDEMKKEVMLKVLLNLCLLCALIRCQDVESNEVDQISNDIINPDDFSEQDQYHIVSKQGATELPGGRLIRNTTLQSKDSPYLLRTDLEIDYGVILTLEPGVTLQVAPMVGITVRGIIEAIVSILHAPTLYRENISGLLPSIRAQVFKWPCHYFTFPPQRVFILLNCVCAMMCKRVICLCAV